jgi:hypothetical protein
MSMSTPHVELRHRVSAASFSVGVFSFEPTSVAATTSISEVWPDPNQTEQIRPPRKQVRREQLLAYEINGL